MDEAEWRRRLEALERDMANIAELSDQIQEQNEKLKKLDDALFSVRPGNGDQKPLIEKINRMVETWDRGNWAIKSMVWFVPTMVSLILFWDQIVHFARSIGKPK